MLFRQRDHSGQDVFSACEHFGKIEYLVWDLFHRLALAAQDPAIDDDASELERACTNRIVQEVLRVFLSEAIPHPDNLPDIATSASRIAAASIVDAPFFQPCDLLADMAVDEFRDKLLRPMEKHWSRQIGWFGGYNGAGRIHELIAAFDAFQPQIKVLINRFVDSIESGGVPPPRCRELAPLVHSLSQFGDLDVPRAWGIVDRITSRVRRLVTEWVRRGGDCNLMVKAAVLRLCHLLAAELEVVLAGEIIAHD